MRSTIIPLALLTAALLSHRAFAQPLPAPETTEPPSPAESPEPQFAADSAVPARVPDAAPSGVPASLPKGLPPGILGGNLGDIPIDLIVDFFVNSTDRGPPSIDQTLEAPDKPFDTIGENFDILSRLVRFANLTDTLTSSSNYTLFAPNDDAFIRTARELGALKGAYVGADAEQKAFDEIVRVFKGLTNRNSPRTVELVRSVLLHHIVPEIVTRDNLFVPTVYETLLKGSVIGTIGTKEIIDENPNVNNPSLVERFVDLEFTKNVTVHVIDRVLIPRFR